MVTGEGKVLFSKVTKWIWLIVAICCLVTAILLEIFPANDFYNKLLGRPALKGFQAPFVLNNYAMKNHLAENVSWESYRDKPLFITTGFTICSATCPISMTFYKRLRQAIGDSAHLALFSIDPHNDNPKRLAQFLTPFDANIIGLQVVDDLNFRRTLAELKQSVVDIPGSNDITHSDYIYLLHPNLAALVVYREQDLASILYDYKLLSEL